MCFLAYVLWKTLEQRQTRAGLGNSPRTILDELRSIQSTDVVLPLAADPHRQLRIRCVSAGTPSALPASCRGQIHTSLPAVDVILSAAGAREEIGAALRRFLAAAAPAERARRIG